MSAIKTLQQLLLHPTLLLTPPSVSVVRVALATDTMPRYNLILFSCINKESVSL
jgi:hypothetical protein